MILFFSATGNTEFIAKRLAEYLDDECMNLLDRIRRDDHTPLRSKKPYVICSPVYIGAIPAFLFQYLRRQRLLGNKNVYLALTSGGFSGVAGTQFRILIERKNMKFRGCAEFQMPQNYVATNLFSQPDDDESKNRIRTSSRQLAARAHRIRSGQTLPYKDTTLIELALLLLFVTGWTRLMQPSKPFYTKENCIGCGKCERICPLNNIRMENGRPRWLSPCAHCMACIGSCPVEAIEYGRVTQKKKKYHISKIMKNLAFCKQEY